MCKALENLEHKPDPIRGRVAEDIVYQGLTRNSRGVISAVVTVGNAQPMTIEHDYKSRLKTPKTPRRQESSAESGGRSPIS